MVGALLLIVYLLAPIALTLGKTRLPFVEKVGVVSLCYCVGIALGNSGIASQEALTVQVLEVVVPLSIPLLLFGADLRIWRTAGTKMLGSFFCGVVAVSVAVAGVSFAFRRALAGDVSDLGGMMMGVYTGGTPNMSAIGIALDVESELFVVLNAADLVFGGAVLLFFISAGKPLIGRILPSTQVSARTAEVAFDEAINAKGSSIGLGLAALVLGAAIGFSMLVFGTLHEMTILLVITSLGIAGSAVPQVRALKGTFAMGNYLLLVFCVAVGSLADLSQVVDTGPTVLGYVGAIIGSTLLLHVALARLFRIDCETMIISSTAGIFGPAFIAPVARAIGNPALIPVGLALALLGFAIGNYLGLAMAYALAHSFG